MWTIGCMLAGLVVISVFLKCPVNPVERITCSIITFFGCRCCSAWVSCSPGWSSLGSMSTETGDVQVLTMTLICFSSHLFLPVNAQSVLLWRRKKTTGKRKRSGLPSSLLRQALAAFHTFLPNLSLSSM